MVADVATGILVLTGTGLVLLAAVGLQRFDDVFARIHAATKATTLGLLLIIVGACLQVNDRGDVAKLLLVAALQFVTAPVSAHMVGRAAYRAGTELSPETVVDDLGAAIGGHRAEPDDLG